MKDEPADGSLTDAAGAAQIAIDDAIVEDGSVTDAAAAAQFAIDPDAAVEDGSRTDADAEIAVEDWGFAAAGAAAAALPEEEEKEMEERGRLGEGLQNYLVGRGRW